MLSEKPMVLRDVIIEEIYGRMKSDLKVFFLSADFGAPLLDKLRIDFPKRFINVGIAEQNLITVATGMALEGYTVYAYGIAPFLIMRAYEQIRINLALLSTLRQLDVTLIGVGIGLSYDVSGPTHHCLEDLGIMRMLPNISIASPCDANQLRKLFHTLVEKKGPKYYRLDGKPLPRIYGPDVVFEVNDGFCELLVASGICIVSTGYMTHAGLEAAQMLKARGISVGLIDLFLIRPVNLKKMAQVFSKYKQLLVVEEGFSGKGGLDAFVQSVAGPVGHVVEGIGFVDQYVFDIGDRKYLHERNGLSPLSIEKKVLEMIAKSV